MTEKHFTSMRLKDQTLVLIKKMVKVTGKTQTAILEDAIEHYALLVIANSEKLEQLEAVLQK